jgi:hypothetical protein
MLRRFLAYLDKVRSYKSTEGIRWAFMKKYEIPDVEHPEKTYLRRWRIIQTPLFALYLHHILMPDGDRDLHDHPYPFASLILAGGYTEERVQLVNRGVMWGTMPGEVTERRVRYDKIKYGDDPDVQEETVLVTHKPWRFNFVPTTAAHRIRFHRRESGTWSLMFVGPRTRTWGFWTAEGFVPHPEYHDRLKFQGRPY